MILDRSIKNKGFSKLGSKKASKAREKKFEGPLKGVGRLEDSVEAIVLDSVPNSTLDHQESLYSPYPHPSSRLAHASPASIDGNFRDRYIELLSEIDNDTPRACSKKYVPSDLWLEYLQFSAEEVFQISMSPFPNVISFYEYYWQCN